MGMDGRINRPRTGCMGRYIVLWEDVSTYAPMVVVMVVPPEYAFCLSSNPMDGSSSLSNDGPE
jgi:hypothetical protein